MDWNARLRPLAIATLSAFLCFLSATVKPWAKLSGQWAFLVYTTQLIFFFPRGRLGSQIESTVLGIAGGTIGIAWSSVVLSIAAYCGRRYGSDSNQTRAILGVGLATLCLVSGLIRSYARRFNVFSKILVFFPIFLLTGEQTITHMSASLFLQQFYVVIFSGALPLISTLLLAPHHTSSHQFGVQVEESLKTICTILPLSFGHVLGQGGVSGSNSVPGSPRSAKQIEDQAEAPPPPPSQDKLAKKLKTTIASLHTSTNSYLKTLKSDETHAVVLPNLVKALQRIVRNPLLGPTNHMPGERIKAALHKSFPHSQPGTPRRSIYAHHPERNSITSMASETDNAMDTYTRRKARHLTGNLRPRDSHQSLVLPTRPGLRDRSQYLVEAMVEALRAVEQELPGKFGWEVLPGDHETEEGPDLRLKTAKKMLEDELSQVQRTLGSLLGDTEPDVREPVMQHHTDSPTGESYQPDDPRMNISESSDVKNVLYNRDRYRLAFYMTALLDLARDVHSLTSTVGDAPVHKKPLDTWAVFFRALWVNRQETVPETADVGRGEEAHLVPDHEQPFDERKEYQDMDFVSATLHQLSSTYEPSNRSHRFQRVWRQLWNQHGVVKARIELSRIMHAVKHSRHVLFSLKLSGGICLLSIPAFMPPGSSARQWYDESRGAWMVISYMFVLEDTTGSILKVGFFRALGTLVGAIVGYICVLIAKQNAYGLTVLATACSVPISYNILFATIPGLGSGTGITLPPILYIPYLGLSKGQTDWFLTWNRFVDIVIGVAAAVLVGTWVWPVHARVQYFRAVSGILSRITEYYLRMSRDLVRSSLVYRVDDKQYEHLESKIKRDLSLGRTLIAIQRQEISLLPRPIKLYSEIIDACERVLEVLIEIRILRFSVPRKETVLDVLPIRRELISTVAINLWTCSHAFGSRAPLLQFLPSPRVPLSELMQVTEDHARHLRIARHAQPRTETDKNGSLSEPSKMGASTETYQAELSVLYAMAENEALGELCDLLEELVAGARTLFGTQTFLYNTL